MSKKAPSPVNSGLGKADDKNRKEANSEAQNMDASQKNQEVPSNSAGPDSQAAPREAANEAESNNTQNAQRGTSQLQGHACDLDAQNRRSADQDQAPSDQNADKDMEPRQQRESIDAANAPPDADDEHQPLDDQQLSQDKDGNINMEKHSQEGDSQYAAGVHQGDDSFQKDQYNQMRNSLNNQKGGDSSNQQINQIQQQQQIAEDENEQQQVDQAQNDDNYSEDDDGNDVFDNQDQNQHFYKEYCRLYYANIILTNRLQQLLDEKQDLGYKLNRLESNKRNHEIVLNMPFEIDNEKKKRHRRTATEIARHYKCPIEDCPKSYGSEGSLNQHIKLKHPEYYQEVIQQSNAQQSMSELVDMTEWQGN